MIEIDRRVVDVSNGLVGVQGDYADPRVTLVFDDGAKFMDRAARAGERFDLIVVDATDSTSPSKVLWTEAFYGNLAACLAEDGVAVDSDNIVPGRDGARLSRDPCDLSIVDIMRAGRFFRRVEPYQARVPCTPAASSSFSAPRMTGRTGSPRPSSAAATTTPGSTAGHSRYPRGFIGRWDLGAPPQSGHGRLSSPSSAGGTAAARRRAGEVAAQSQPGSRPVRDIIGGVHSMSNTNRASCRSAMTSMN